MFRGWRIVVDADSEPKVFSNLLPLTTYHYFTVSRNLKIEAIISSLLGVFFQ